MPNFEVSFAPPRKKMSSRERITYEKMIRYINRQDNNEKHLKDMNEVRFPENCLTPAPYGKVKKWFLVRFPYYNRLTEFDEFGHIIYRETREVRNPSGNTPTSQKDKKTA